MNRTAIHKLLAVEARFPRARRTAAGVGIDIGEADIGVGAGEHPVSRFWRGIGGWRGILAVLVVLGLLAWIARPKPAEDTANGRFGLGAPMAVNVAKAEVGDMPVILNALGTVTPLATVTVRTQISGQLQQIGFTEGQVVKKGDFLAQIDPHPYQAALEQAEGTLAKDQALLKNAQLDLARYQKLVAEDSIAHQQADTQAALVRQYQGQIVTDQAAVDSARVNLNYCHIESPTNGRVGLREVDQGNYVTPSDTNGIVVVTQLQPVSIIFTLPEDNVLQVTKPLHAGATLEAVAYDRGSANKLAAGRLTNVDNQIDTATGTFKLRAEFANDDESLFPNQFVNIQLLVDTLHNQTVVPTASIQHGAPGTFVYVVNPDSTVSVKPVAPLTPHAPPAHPMRAPDLTTVTATATSRLQSSGPWSSWNLRHERCLYCYRSPRKLRLTGTAPWSSRD